MPSVSEDFVCSSRIGRKPRSDDGPAVVVFCVRLTLSERATVDAAARVNLQNPSQFVRDAIVEAASECLEEQPPRP